MDETRRLERNARRRRSLVAWAASLAIHAAFFGLLFSVKSSLPSINPGLAVSIRIAQDTGAPRRSRAVSASRSAVRPAARPTDEGALSDASSADEAKKAEAPRPIADASGDSRADGPSGLSEALPGSIGGIASGGESVAALAERVGSAIEARKTYPETARRRGAEGIVALKLRVAGDGRLLVAKLVASSGSTLLDRAALDLAASVFPVDNIVGRELELSLSVRYELKR